LLLISIPNRHGWYSARENARYAAPLLNRRKINDAASAALALAFETIGPHHCKLRGRHQRGAVEELTYG